MGSFPSVHVCPCCRSRFRKEEDLVRHLVESSQCRRPQDSEAFTAKLESGSRIDKVNLGSRRRIEPLTLEIVSEVARKAKIDMDRVADFFSKAQNVSICFLLDTTGSMASYISGVKDQIVQIVHQVESSGCGIAGLAFVGYKDWCDGEKHFEILPFTEDVMKLKKFVEGIRAGGGGDPPEDVVGGLNKAVRLSWPEGSGTRVLFHLGDAPPHGKGKYHDVYDSYPDGHPMDRPLDSLFQEMKIKKIFYYFGRINNNCDRMILVFEAFYGKKIDQLDSSVVSTLSSDVTSSVMKSVSASCSATMSTVELSGETLRTYELDPKEPDWPHVPLVDAAVLIFKLPESISVITSYARMEVVLQKCLVQIAPNPFAKGSARLAYYGRIIHSSNCGESPSASDSWDPKPPPINEAVFKEFISLPKVDTLDRQRYWVVMEVQTVASKLAFEFNDRLARTTCDPDVKLKFLIAKVIRTIPKDGFVPRFMAYEKRFRGPSPPMVRYTNNLNFVTDTLDEAGRTRLELVFAFSHFTHSVTEGYLLVCDPHAISTAGKKKKSILLLTDPVIHCAKHLRFGKSNLGAMGMNNFFAEHVCNQYCRALGLTMPSEE